MGDDVADVVAAVAAANDYDSNDDHYYVCLHMFRCW